jgi:hypothetical protein
VPRQQPGCLPRTQAEWIGRLSGVWALIYHSGTLRLTQVRFNQPKAGRPEGPVLANTARSGRSRSQPEEYG